MSHVSAAPKPVCAVFDRKIGMFDSPFACRHVGEATRQFQLVATQKDTKIGMNPEDFQLFHIGWFDEVTGRFENVIPHLHLDSGVANAAHV